jgi:hypothetical protein
MLTSRRPISRFTLGYFRTNERGLGREIVDLVARKFYAPKE